MIRDYVFTSFYNIEAPTFVFGHGTLKLLSIPFQQNAVLFIMAEEDDPQPIGTRNKEVDYTTLKPDIALSFTSRESMDNLIGSLERLRDDTFTKPTEDNDK